MSVNLAPATQILLQNSFYNNAQLNPAVWGYNVFSPVNNPSFNGRTQMEQHLPSVADGALQLTVQTYNPTSNPPGTSFLGSEVISNQTFQPTGSSEQGIAFTAVARIADPVPGMVGGIFAYNFNSSTNLHDEIDFESLTNNAAAGVGQEETNIYGDQPLGTGNPASVSDPGLDSYQTYTFEWFPNQVLWFINGQLVQENTTNVPQNPMAFHLNFYAPASSWSQAFSASLMPVASSSADSTYTFDVAYVSVANIEDADSGIAVQDISSAQAIAASPTTYTGPVANLGNQYINSSSDNLNIGVDTPGWFIHSGSGEDAIAASSGTNVLDGGTGSNFLTGGSGVDTFFVDDRAPLADIWSTIGNFHTGDAATIWGVTPQDFNLAWVDRQGASGYTGLTLHATAAGSPTASLTLVGYNTGDLSNGRLSVEFGADPTSGSPYMYVHGN